MAKSKIDMTIEGMEELVNLVKRMGELPQKTVTAAAKEGGKIALASAKALAPVDDGDLRNGIIMKGEKKTVNGKKVYDVMIDPAKNDTFVKMSADGKTRYYYPASIEYGFKTKSGRKVPGVHFLRDSLTTNKERIERAVLDKLIQALDKELAKRG